MKQALINRIFTFSSDRGPQERGAKATLLWNISNVSGIADAVFERTYVS